MTSCEIWTEKLQGWAHEQWETAAPGIEPPDWLREHTGQCPRCAAKLQAVLLLLRGSESRPAPSPGLAGRITAQLALEGRPRSRSWRRWVALPVAAALVAALTFFVTYRLGDAAPTDTVAVRLVLEAPGARQVSVVGDWNGWDPTADPLTDRDRDGLWEIELRLRRGQEQQYQFLIDGERWVPDPDSPLRVEDGFGGFNSILQI